MLITGQECFLGHLLVPSVLSVVGYVRNISTTVRMVGHGRCVSHMGWGHPPMLGHCKREQSRPPIAQEDVISAKGRFKFHPNKQYRISRGYGLDDRLVFGNKGVCWQERTCHHCMLKLHAAARQSNISRACQPKSQASERSERSVHSLVENHRPPGILLMSLLGGSVVMIPWL